MIRYRLLTKKSERAVTGESWRSTSLPSRGVPGIGTRALTGKDSGCSGMLETEVKKKKVFIKRHVNISTDMEKKNLLRNFINQSYSITVRFS